MVFVLFAFFGFRLSFVRFTAVDIAENITERHSLSTVAHFAAKHFTQISEIKIIHIFHELSHLFAGLFKLLVTDAHFVNHLFNGADIKLLSALNAKAFGLYFIALHFLYKHDCRSFAAA